MSGQDDMLPEILDQWDEVNNAIQNVLTALPSQMTENAAHLDRQRLKMRALLMNIGRRQFALPQPHPERNA